MAEEEKKYGVKDPNEGTNGSVASNMTGEAITANYDYGNITDNDKKVVMESAKKISLDFLNWPLVKKLFDIIEITSILKHSKRMKLAPNIYTYT